jgi:type III pantothenate kinase
MASSHLALAIDIGNTHTDIGLIDTKKLSCTGHTILGTADVALKLGPAIRLFLESDPAPETIVVSSVVTSLRPAVEKVIGSFTGVRLVWLGFHPLLPIEIEYENPAALGVDRIADCLYAHAAFPGKDQIIIDAGTTITVDFLRSGKRFLGGAIVPGILTQLKSLHKGTAELPEIRLRELCAGFPGTSTQGCISAGVRYSVAGGLNELVGQYKRAFGEQCIVLATGGTWEFTRELVDFPFIYNPDMTLIGTGLFGCPK